MSKKKLNVDEITNELAGNSAFFPDYKKDDSSTSSQTLTQKDLTKDQKGVHNKDSKIDSMNASTIASSKELIEYIRKAVKEVGKEALFLRITPEEKNQLKDIVFALSKQRPKISDNEVGRIALNHLLEDYKANGKNSILAKAIDALNA